jgi:hypothetical protein
MATRYEIEEPITLDSLIEALKEARQDAGEDLPIMNSITEITIYSRGKG